MILSTKILMELELGLALPNHTPGGRLDLNCNINHNGLEIVREKIKSHKNQKRAGFDDQDGIDEVESKALSLLLWSGQPNEEDEKWRKLHLNTEIKYDDEENQEIVGWPPITSLRKELLHSGQNQGNNWMANRNRRERVVAVRNSMYVKVKMEGVAIGRKIDLRLHTSYPALTNTLINMFAKYSKIHRNYADYTILYQDKEGDWMPAGDVPWETFIESVQRIEILRNDRDS